MKIARYLSDDANRVRCPGLQFNDLASLAAGVKEVVYTSIRDRREAAALDALCADLKFKKVILGGNRSADAAPVTDLLIGTSAKKLAAAEKAYREVRSGEWGVSFEWGMSLDYPECCVRSYIAWHTGNGGGDLIRHIRGLSPAGTTFPFWMNNVFNYYSRLNTPLARREYLAFSDLNRGLDRESIVPWHPCSYMCAATLKKGWLIYEVLKRLMPRTAACRRELLSKPVVFRDKFLFAVLNGRCGPSAGGFGVAYKGLAAPRSLLAAGTEKALSAVEALRLSPSGMITSPRKLRLPEGCFVIPFAP
ncbi:MAG: hypothetical protein HY550_12355 [Elusimicrobia bacterium]|nr:hypothetical protein [Elusimicrobiota bacterium]